MRNGILPQAEKYYKKHNKYRLWQKIVGCLACVVVFCITYAMILPAITLEETTYCGEEAHEHDETCYEERLVCGYDDAKEEESSDDQDEAEGEEKQTSEHVHTKDCYERVLICGKTEHTHELSCYSDSEADVESQSVWEQNLPRAELTEIWADDVVAVAESQLGYKESEKNYTVTEEGDKKGITRYGQWYGDPYGDWSATFVSFCLNYADVPESVIPYEADCAEWVNVLAKKDLYQNFDKETVKKGDLVFLDQDGDSKADHVGIVTEVSEESNTIKMIEGDLDNCVKYASYQMDDSEIEGYVSLPENPEMSTSSDDSSERKEQALDSEALDEEQGAEDYSGQQLSLRTIETNEQNETISIHVEKQWVGDAAYVRPETLTVTLQANGEDTGNSITLTADNDWSGAFEGNFPKYDDQGNEIIYTIQESTIENYELVSNNYTDTASTVDLTTLELWVPVTELEEGEEYLAVSGLSGKQSLYRAESTVTDGVLAANVTVNEGSVKDQDGNTYTNYILLNTEDESGQSQYLTWKAVSVAGGMNLQSNVYTAWNGATKYLLDQSGKWKVTGDGMDSGAIFVSDGDKGFRTQSSTSFLYLFRKVSLDVSSLPASSYTRNYTLVNRYEPTSEIESTTPDATSTSVKVKKEWADNADHSGDSVTVCLMRDGERTEQSLTLNAENNWTATFTNLPIYNEKGKEYVYDVEEVETVGYQAEYTYNTATVTGDAVWLPTDKFEDGVTYLIVTSVLTGDVIGLEGQENGVAWTSDSKAGTIYVSSSDAYSRYITDEEAQQHTAMQWTAEYLGLKKANQVGSRYVYALKNVQYQKYLKNNGQGNWSSDCNGDATWWYYGYTLTDAAGKTANRYPKKNPESDWSYILGSMNDYFLLDNNHTGDGGSQAAQTFYLYRRYEIQEPQLQVTITNSPVKQTSLTVRKEWAGDNSDSRPGSIEVQLLANGEKTEKTLTLTKDTEWSGVFENLPVEDASGHTIEYTVSEASVDGYTANCFYSTDEDGYKVVITNTATSSGYELPETGGHGTTLFTLSGLCMIVSSLVYRYFARRRRERRAGQ